MPGAEKLTLSSSTKSPVKGSVVQPEALEVPPLDPLAEKPLVQPDAVQIVQLRILKF